MQPEHYYSSMPSNVIVPEQAIPGEALLDLLLLDAEPVTAKLALLLRGNYRVSVSSSARVAREFLRRGRAAVIITELELADGTGAEICREAKAFPKPPIVLVMTANVERVPDALEAQCDGVLLKPFAPNLLISRLGRLVRGRTQHPQRSNPSTNRFWADGSCPYCDAKGITSFEFASHRRSWYACGGCRKVWLGRRRE